jgi:uncharacterized membrane protein
MTSDLSTIARGDGSAVMQARRTIVRNAAEWRALWAAHAGPATPEPVVDFEAQMVAAAFAGERPSPGFEIEITGTRRNGPALTVVVEERSPVPGRVAAQVIVSPFHIVALPRYDGEVRFSDHAGQAAASARPQLPVTPDAPASWSSAGAPSSTGLDPNFAAALAYLAGPFSGILILLVERPNRYVRFHAWQAVVGLGGLGLLATAALVFSFATLLVSPLVFTLMYRLSELLAILWVVAWGVCLVKAFTGNEWKMPVAGRYAKRLASRHS